MELAEVEQEVTNFLLSALELSHRPPAGMCFCRLAAECIIHNLHFQEFGEFPISDEKGNYPSLTGIVTRVKGSIERQTSEVLYSINAQSRGSLHWDFESRGKGAKKHHVEVVVNQISNTFNDIHGVELSLTGVNVSDDELAETIRRTLSELIAEQGISWDSNASQYHLDSQKLNEILEIATGAIGKGLDFDDWMLLDIASCAVAVGRYEIADELMEGARIAFRKSGDRIGEACSMNILAEVAEIRGRSAEAEKLLSNALEILLEEEDGERAASLLNNLGNSALGKGDLVEAERNFNRALEILTRDGVDKGSFKVRLGLATIRIAESKLGEAVEILVGILNQENEFDNNAGFNPRFKAGALSNLGLCYLRLGDLFNLKVMSGEIPGERSVERDILSDLAPKDIVGKIVSAFQRITHSLPESEKPKDEDADSQLSHYYTKAERCIKDSIAIYRGLPDPHKLFKVQELLAMFLLKVGPTRWAESELLLRDVVRLSNEHGFPLTKLPNDTCWFELLGYTDPNAQWDYPPRPKYWRL